MSEIVATPHITNTNIRLFSANIVVSSINLNIEFIQYFEFEKGNRSNILILAVKLGLEIICLLL